MSKKIPVINITNKFIGNNKNLYFFKNFNYQLGGNSPYFNSKKEHKYRYFKHILPEELKEEIITNKDNIVCPLVMDTEYTAFNGNLQTINVDYLRNLENRQLIQLKVIDNKIKQKCPKLKGVFELANLENINSIDQNYVFESDKFKQIPSIHLTSQFKHIFYNDHTILLNPKIKKLYEENITDPNYLYPYYNLNSQGHMFDYLNLKGFDISIVKSDLPNKEFNKFKSCTFKLYAYFMLADLPKILQNELGEDLKEAFIKKKIKQERRLSVNGFSDKWHTKRLITINGITYRLVFDFVDLGAMQGKISYSSVLENLNMDISDKNLLDDLKDNMLLAIFDKSNEFKKYALGDLNIYEAFKKTNDLFTSVYKELKLDNYITEIMLTTGSTVNQLQKSILLKYLGLNDLSKGNLKKLNTLTKTASASNLRNYINASEKIKSGGCLKRQFLSKTMGGRCYNNRMEIRTTSSLFTLCDIDISGAYTTIASTLDYYFGCPVILNFNPYKVTLREFLKYYEKKYLIKRGFKLVIETKKDRLLTIEQDLLASWIDTRIKNYVVNQGINEQILSIMNLENTPTGIFTKELINSNLTWDELDIIRNEFNKKQRDEILDNTYLKAAIFYPKNFECETINDLFKNIETHERKGKSRFDDIMPYCTLDNEDSEYSHYWNSTNFGELIVNDIIQYRAINKKINASLSYLYKLIGNTIYGINVSRHFDNSNIVLGANITAMARCGMWLTEKALNIFQTITDGGVFNLNEVVHLTRNKIDTSIFVRAYQLKKHELSEYRKWKNKPITENGKKITYHENKGWLIDNIYYGCDRDLLVRTIEEYNNHVKMFGENDKRTLEKNNELSLLEDKIKELYNKINQLVIRHIRKVFPNNDLFNGTFKKIKVDKNGIAIRDNKNNYIYENAIGVFNFEVKNFCNDISFHGSADYLYKNIKDEEVIKMRGYDVKPNVVSWTLENNNLVSDTNYYNEIAPINRFMKDLQERPENVRIPRPFTKSTILKTAQFSKEYNKTWRHANTKCGDDFIELVKIPIFTLRFKFQSIKQQKSWNRYYNKLKRRFEGLSFEVFYMNKDGTINYEKMMREIDQYISKGIINPKDIYDKSNHLFRDINKHNYNKNQHILNYMKLIRNLKNLVRITVVGAGQFLKENSKLNTDSLTLIMKKPKYVSKIYYNSFEDVNTYSNNNAFWDYRNIAQ
jgi:hypothetical protein